MRVTFLISVLWLSAGTAYAQTPGTAGEARGDEAADDETRSDEAADETADEDEFRLRLAPDLPSPTLEGAEPIGAAEPLPEPPQEEQPAVLEHIGTGDHPEWEEDEDASELPHDIPFDTPNTFEAPNDPGGAPSARGAAIYGADPEEDPPPYVLAAGAGFARLLAVAPIDFFRVEERFEAQISELPGFRFGIAASQMFAEQGFVAGGGIRIGMGAILCDLGDVLCEGVVYVQPGFLAGLTGPRFDLNANLSVRLLLFRRLSISVDGGYSLLFDGVSLLHVGGSLGVGF